MGKILSPEDHSCFSAFPPPQCYILFMSKLWAFNMKNEARATTWSSTGPFLGLVVRNQLTIIYLWWVNTIYTHFRIFSTCKHSAVPYTERISLDASPLFPIITCHVFLISHYIYYPALLNTEFLLLQSVWVVWSTSCSVSVPPLISTLEMIAGS